MRKLRYRDFEESAQHVIRKSWSWTFSPDIPFPSPDSLLWKELSTGRGAVKVMESFAVTQEAGECRGPGAGDGRQLDFSDRAEEREVNRQRTRRHRTGTLPDGIPASSCLPNLWLNEKPGQAGLPLVALHQARSRASPRAQGKPRPSPQTQSVSHQVHVRAGCFLLEPLWWGRLYPEGTCFHSNEPASIQMHLLNCYRYIQTARFHCLYTT